MQRSVDQHVTPCYAPVGWLGDVGRSSRHTARWSFLIVFYYLWLQDHGNGGLWDSPTVRCEMFLATIFWLFFSFWSSLSGTELLCTPGFSPAHTDRRLGNDMYFTLWSQCYVWLVHTVLTHTYIVYWVWGSCLCLDHIKWSQNFIQLLTWALSSRMFF